VGLMLLWMNEWLYMCLQLLLLLWLLQDMMKTEGRRLAAARHAFMEQYLDQFQAEWRGAA
jgi:hypothetical protein